MATYRYNVIVEVDINAPKPGQASGQVKGYFNSIEAQARQSAKTIEKNWSDSFRTQEMAWQRHVQKLQNYNDQIAANRRNSQRAVDEQSRMDLNKTLANQDAAYARHVKSVAGYYKQMGMLDNPNAIWRQTGAQAQQQAKLMNFASNEIATAQQNINRVLSGQQIVDADRNLKNLTNSFNSNAKSVGIWGQAFKGAFVGAVAGMTFATVISGITGFIGSLKDLGVASVQVAADFQVTRNAFTVFTGSMSAARSELSQIAQVAKNTPGLRLEDAEAGAKNLRALGFEAELALDLVEGLAKQKILSGADEGAVNRVIVNLTQLASGSPRASQDIREMIQSIRTLRPELIATFGSIDEFRRQIAQDPEGALAKFAQGLKDTKVPAAGLTDATYKLLDAFTVAGRKFGEPLLDPLTESFKILTNALENNGAAWTAWGQNIGDAIRGANQTLRGSPLGANSNIDPVVAGLATLGPLGWLGAAAYDTYREIGKGERQQREREAYQRSIEGEPALRRQLGVAYGPVSEDMVTERATELERQKQKRAADQERLRRDSLANMEAFHKAELSELKNAFATENALRRSHLDLTLDDQIATTKALGAIKQKELRDTLALQLKQNKAVFDSGKLTRAESIALAREQDALINEAGAARIQAAAETNAELARLNQERIDNQRRSALEEIDIAKQAVGVMRDEQIDQIQRQIDFTESGFNELIDVYNDSYAQMVDLTQQSYAKQLEDQRLTAEERVNLEQQMNLELRRLQIDHNREVQRAQDAAWELYKRRVDRQSQEMQSMYQSRGALNAGTFALFSPGLVARGGVDASINAVFGDLITRQREADAAVSRITDDATRDDALTKLKMVNAELGKFGNLQLEVLDLVNALKAGKGDYTVFDQIAEKAYFAERAIQRASLESAIDAIEAKLKVGAPPSEEDALRKALVRGQQGLKAFDYETELGKQNLETRNNLLRQYQALISKPEAQAATLYQATNQQLKQQIALQQELILLSDEKYVQTQREIEATQDLISIRQSQIRIADQYIYSQRRADSAVLEFLAQQKGITEIVADTKINLLTTAYSGLEAVADRLTRKFGAFRDVIKDLVANMLKLAFNRLFGNMFAPGGSGGGGFFGSLGQPAGGGVNLGGINLGGGLNILGGIGGGIGPGGTPYFNPNSGGTSGSPLDIFLGPGSSQVLLGRGAAQQGSIGGMLGSGGGLLGGLGAGLGSILPFLGAGIGASLGGKSLAGNILGGIGGGILGAIGGTILTGGGLLAALPGSLGATLLPLLLNPFTAIAAGALIPLAIILGRNKRRREEEKIRNQAMLDAFAAIDKLIKDVNSDRIDGSQALAQADAIRQQYLDQMNQLKDKKTRTIALREVSRIDSKIQELKAAAATQTARRERLELMVPTFAYGGPVGYQQGAGHGMSDNILQYFPSARTYGFTSPTEYVLDARTTQTIGRSNLDAMVATGGQSYASMRRQTTMPKMARGGSPIGTSNFDSTNGTTTASGPVTLEVQMNVTLGTETLVEVVSAAVKGNDGSKRQIDTIITSLKNDGEQNDLVKYLKMELDKLG